MLIQSKSDDGKMILFLEIQLSNLNNIEQEAVKSGIGPIADSFVRVLDATMKSGIFAIEGLELLEQSIKNVASAMLEKMLGAKKPTSGPTVH